MGLIKAALGSVGGVLADQWREYFYCDSLEDGVIVTKGVKRTTRRGSNKKGSDNIISNGSVIAVNEGQCTAYLNKSPCRCDPVRFREGHGPSPTK